MHSFEVHSNESTRRKKVRLRLEQVYKKKTTNDEFINGLEHWHTVKTDKTKVVKGRTYYWCPLHVKEVMWNGIYVTHKPKDHKRKIPNSQRTTVEATQGTDGAANKKDN